jgi:uncharacterized membrane protein
MDIKQQQAVKLWYAIQLWRDIIIIVLSAFFMQFLLKELIDGAYFSQYQKACFLAGIGLFFMALSSAFISINQFQEKMAFEMTGNAYDLTHIFIQTAKIISFLLGLIDLVVIGSSFVC